MRFQDPNRGRPEGLGHPHASSHTYKSYLARMRGGAGPRRLTTLFRLARLAKRYQPENTNEDAC